MAYIKRLRRYFGLQSQVSKRPNVRKVAFFYFRFESKLVFIKFILSQFHFFFSFGIFYSAFKTIYPVVVFFSCSDKLFKKHI